MPLITLLPSAARTVTNNGPDRANFNDNIGAILVVDVSSITLTPILTPKLQLKDPISGNYIDIWTAAANLIATGTVAYVFGLGGSGGAGDYAEGVNLLVPRTFRFRMIHADTDSATYSAAINLLG